MAALSRPKSGAIVGGDLIAEIAQDIAKTKGKIEALKWALED